MSDIEQDEDYQVCDQCKETIYGEWVCYCWKCENDREKIIKSIGSIDHVWCVADVYDAAMEWMDEVTVLLDGSGMNIDKLLKELTPCSRTLYLACRRAKEGK